MARPVSAMLEILLSYPGALGSSCKGTVRSMM